MSSKVYITNTLGFSTIPSWIYSHESSSILYGLDPTVGKIHNTFFWKYNNARSRYTVTRCSFQQRLRRSQDLDLPAPFLLWILRPNVGRLEFLSYSYPHPHPPRARIAAICKPTPSPGPTRYHTNTKITRALARSGVEICTGVEAKGTHSEPHFPSPCPTSFGALSNKEAGPLPSLV